MRPINIDGIVWTSLNSNLSVDTARLPLTAGRALSLDSGWVTWSGATWSTSHACKVSACELDLWQYRSRSPAITDLNIFIWMIGSQAWSDWDVHVCQCLYCIMSTGFAGLMLLLWVQTWSSVGADWSELQAHTVHEHDWSWAMHVPGTNTQHQNFQSKILKQVWMLGLDFHFSFLHRLLCRPSLPLDLYKTNRLVPQLLVSSV